MTNIKISVYESDCLIKVTNNTSNLVCDYFWYNDNLYNFIDSGEVYSWVNNCAHYLYMYNWGEKIRKGDDAIYANVIVKEPNPDLPNTYRCRVASCTAVELENIFTHARFFVGVSLGGFCGDNITLVHNNSGLPSSFPTQFPASFPASFPTLFPTPYPSDLSPSKVNSDDNIILLTLIIVCCLVFIIIMNILVLLRLSLRYIR